MLCYLTTDAVNAETARTLAALLGLQLPIVEPRDLPQLEKARAELVLDWDFLPEDFQRVLLDGAAVNIVALHSHNLSDALAGFLLRRGIFCARQNDQRLFRALRGDAAAA